MTDLITRIAEYLAAENRDEMSRVYVEQADEILAMVREADRAYRTVNLLHAVRAAGLREGSDQLQAAE